MLPRPDWRRAAGHVRAWLGRGGRLYHWPLVPVVLLALAFRIINLFPTFLYGDDALYATVADNLRQGGFNLAYPDIESHGPHPFVSQPPFVLYLFANAAILFGDTETGAVATSILLGVGTVAIVYAIGNLVNGRATAILSGLFLAVLPFHVTMSRKAFLEAGLTFFMALTLLLFVLWTQRSTLSLAVATGLAASATVLSKLSGVLVLVPLAIGLLWVLLPELRFPLERRRILRHGVWMAVPVATGVFLYAALLWFLRATVNLSQKLGWQVARTTGTTGTDTPAVVSEGKPWHWYFTDANFSIVQQLGLILFVLALVGAVGLFLFIDRRRLPYPAAAALLAWPVVVLAFFTWSEHKEWFYIVPSAPAFAILGAIPVAKAWELYRTAPMPDAWVKLRRTNAAVVAAAILLASVPIASPAAQSIEVFAITEKSFGFGLKEAADWIEERDPDAAQVGTTLGRFSLHFYNQNPTYHWYLPHAYVEDEIQAGRLRFVVIDDYLGDAAEGPWMEGLVAKYDGALRASYTPPHEDEPRVWIYEVRPIPA